MRPCSIQWAAGLFEGEGCFSSYTRNGRVTHRLELATTDKDVLERFVEIVGTVKNQVRPMHKNVPAHYKPVFRWSITSKAEVLRVTRLLLPYLGNRRAYKALNILDDLELSM